MSSFTLLELFGVTVTDDPEAQTRTIRVDFAPEDGALAAAMREGERPEWKQALAQSANVLAVLRCAHAPDADGEEYGERLFLPIERLRELEAEHLAREAERHRNQSDDDDPGGLYSLWQQQEVS